jgi:hypothetical protein
MNSLILAGVAHLFDSQLRHQAGIIAQVRVAAQSAHEAT